MTGSASDAVGLVREAYLRSQSSELAEIVSLQGSRLSVITRLALDDLKVARVTHEQYVGTRVPEPILASSDSELSLSGLEQEEALSLASLRLLETLRSRQTITFTGSYNQISPV